jgi:hypothetical protein
VRDARVSWKPLIALLALASLEAGCSSTSLGGLEQASQDIFSSDAQWFRRSGRVFIRNVSIDAAPLTPEKPVTPEDLVSADGACPGMAASANALTDGAAGAPPPTGGTVALLHTECDVVRGRMAVVTYLRGPRAGIYTFTGGRLSSVEAAPDQPGQPKAAKPKAKKKPA